MACSHANQTRTALAKGGKSSVAVRTWISYKAKRTVGEDDSVMCPPLLAALTDTTRINVVC